MLELTTEEIEDILEEFGILGTKNYFFMGQKVPSKTSNLVFSGINLLVGIIVNAFRSTDYIIAKIDDDLIFIPFKWLTPKLEKAIKFPAYLITKIIVEKGDFDHIKIKFMKDYDIYLSFEIPLSVLENERYYDNFTCFVNSFPNEGIEEREKITRSFKFYKVLTIIVIITIIIGGIYGFYYERSILGAILIPISLVFYYLMFVYNRK